jgi:hypothetical protein
MNGHERIEETDLRIAISNADSSLLAALMTGTLVEDLISKFERGEYINVLGQ